MRQSRRAVYVALSGSGSFSKIQQASALILILVIVVFCGHKSFSLGTPLTTKSGDVRHAHNPTLIADGAEHINAALCHVFYVPRAKFNWAFGNVQFRSPCLKRIIRRLNKAVSLGFIWVRRQVAIPRAANGVVAANDFRGSAPVVDNVKNEIRRTSTLCQC